MFTYTKDRLPYICGFAGPEVSQEEIQFFLQYPPVGFILFARNCKSKSQIKDLTDSLRKLLNETSIPILIDEEGGKVSRLSTFSSEYLTPYISTFEKSDSGKNACMEHYTKISKWLVDLGITVNCAPVLDVKTPNTAAYLQPRCFSDDPKIVSSLGSIAISAMKTNRIVPVMKHLPGKGQAKLDSHFDLPTVEEEFSQEQSHAFHEQSSSCPWAMSSHIVFTRLDSTQPVTFSYEILQNLIRKNIGFDGFLVTDDLFMGALKKFSLKERVQRTLAAGHDSALMCHGTPDEWFDAIKDLKPLNEKSQERLLKKFSRR